MNFPKEIAGVAVHVCEAIPEAERQLTESDERDVLNHILRLQRLYGSELFSVAIAVCPDPGYMAVEAHIRRESGSVAVLFTFRRSHHKV